MGDSLLKNAVQCTTERHFFMGRRKTGSHARQFAWIPLPLPSPPVRTGGKRRSRPGPCWDSLPVRQVAALAAEGDKRTKVEDERRAAIAVSG